MRKRVGIVTGGCSGIGYEVSNQMIEDGIFVCILDQSDSPIKTLPEKTFKQYVVDVTSYKQAFECCNAIFEEHGRIDYLINCAGVFGPIAEIDSLEQGVWERVIAVNLTGTFVMCKAASKFMQKQNGGRIVNMSSISGKEGNPGISAYCASKAGVIGFTKAVSKELCKYGILVHAIAPVGVDGTGMMKDFESKSQALIQQIPLGRFCKSSEVAALVMWLISPKCSFTTGAVHDLSGGRASY